MSKSLTDQIDHDIATVEKISGGGTPGGTEFCQSPGEAKVNDADDGKTGAKPASK